MKKTKVKISELKMGPIRQEVLPEGFIVRVQKFKDILKEVEKSSLEEAVSNFQRDMLPESELEIWEDMARRYEITLKHNSQLDISEKTKIFKEILESTF